MALRTGLSHSINTSAFIIDSLRIEQRADGRGLHTMRNIRLSFARSEGKASAEVQLGRTRALAVVSCEVIPPYPDRPTEGLLSFSVELSKMAEESVGAQRSPPIAIEIARIIEREFKDTQALDSEALCIVAGEKVWQLRVDIFLLDHGGNLTDAAALAAVAALQHFRLPEVTVEGDHVVVHHSDEREALPLALHHAPVCLTFALFEDSAPQKQRRQHFVLDPTDIEEEGMNGRITYALNAQKEICALHKDGGAPVSADTLLSCLQMAATKVSELHKMLASALEAADSKAIKERTLRLRATAPLPPMQAAQSTPFATQIPAAEVEIPEEPEIPQVDHLDYDALHVTGKVWEEDPLAPGRRGLQGVAAAKSDLFNVLTKAAAATAARTSLSNKTVEQTPESMEFEEVANRFTKKSAQSPPPPPQRPTQASKDSSDSEEEETSVLVSQFHKTTNNGSVDAMAVDIETHVRVTAVQATAGEDSDGDDLMAAIKSRPKQPKGKEKGKGKARK